MSACARSISLRVALIASMSPALACRDDAEGIARHFSTFASVSFFNAESRSSRSLIVTTTRWSSTGRDDETVDAWGGDARDGGVSARGGGKNRVDRGRSRSRARILGLANKARETRGTHVRRISPGTS
eukprot:31093-Pelagococcus_subviridis.AAC.17